MLNTYDNSKRFLKEMDYSKEEKKQRFKSLRDNNFHHYSGSAMGYAPGVPDYFGEFKIYQLNHKEMDPKTRRKMASYGFS